MATHTNMLFTPWTMKLSQGPVKFVIGCWTRHRTSSVYTKGKNVKVNMGFEAPKRHILRPTLSTHMVQQVLRWERQKSCSSRNGQGPMANYRCYKFFLLKCFMGNKRQRQEKTKEWSSLIFGHIWKKSAHSLLAHGHSTWSTLGLHLVRDTKAL